MSDYSDLPEWVRPGLKAHYVDATVEIVRITPARIVVKTSYNREIQFDRKPISDSTCKHAGCQHAMYKGRVPGSYFNYLRPLFCVQVVRERLNQRRKLAVQAVADLEHSWNRGDYAERRKRGEDLNDLVLEWLDEAENTVRKQRAKLLAAIERHEKRKAEINVEPGA